MRPQSILMFERLFLASLALSALSAALNYQEMTDLFANDPSVRQLGLGSGLLIGIVIASYMLYLLLWYLIARRASNAAKWILVVFTVIGALSALPVLAGPLSSAILLPVAVYGLQIAAVVYLFRADTKVWFDGSGPADPATFD